MLGPPSSWRHELGTGRRLDVRLPASRVTTQRPLAESFRRHHHGSLAWHSTTQPHPGGEPFAIVSRPLAATELRGNRGETSRLAGVRAKLISPSASRRRVRVAKVRLLLKNSGFAGLPEGSLRIQPIGY
jgi:hypothetical protein